MSILPHTDSSTITTPYPFNASRREFELALQRIPIADLWAEIEAARWLILDVSGDTRLGGNHAVALVQLETLVDEFRRRRRLWQDRSSDPIRPTWPRHDDKLKARVDTVKAAWPIERFCVDVLGTTMQRGGRDRLKAHCPLPGHDDHTPSFTVYLATDSAWCHGCNRGGDIIALTGYMFGHERFYDRLEHLERLSGHAERVPA